MLFANFLTAVTMTMGKSVTKIMKVTTLQNSRPCPQHSEDKTFDKGFGIVTREISRRKLPYARKANA